MTSLVLDANVAAKWMLPAKGESLRAEAYRLLDAYGVGAVDLVVPDVFWAECGKILWKAVRQNRFSKVEAELALISMISRGIPTVSSKKLLPDAVAIAFDFNLTIYDCLYVALAVQTKKDLITADERLANPLAARFPVKWLGAF